MFFISEFCCFLYDYKAIKVIPVCFCNVYNLFKDLFKDLFNTQKISIISIAYKPKYVRISCIYVRISCIYVRISCIHVRISCTKYVRISCTAHTVIHIHVRISCTKYVRISCMYIWL